MRLPTEALWEFACRAGTMTRYYSGDSIEDLLKVAWFGQEWSDGHRAVGLLKPNAWGLFDMLGNIFNWNQDRWHHTYEGAPENGFVAWDDDTGYNHSMWVDGTLEELILSRFGAKPPGQVFEEMEERERDPQEKRRVLYGLNVKVAPKPDSIKTRLHVGTPATVPFLIAVDPENPGLEEEEAAYIQEVPDSAPPGRSSVEVDEMICRNPEGGLRLMRAGSAGPRDGSDPIDGGPQRRSADSSMSRSLNQSSPMLNFAGAQSGRLSSSGEPLPANVPRRSIDQGAAASSSHGQGISPPTPELTRQRERNQLEEDPLDSESYGLEEVDDEVPLSVEEPCSDPWMSPEASASSGGTPSPAFTERCSIQLPTVEPDGYLELLQGRGSVFESLGRDGKALGVDLRWSALQVLQLEQTRTARSKLLALLGWCTRGWAFDDLPDDVSGNADRTGIPFPSPDTGFRVVWC